LILEEMHLIRTIEPSDIGIVTPITKKKFTNENILALLSISKKSICPDNAKTVYRQTKMSNIIFDILKRFLTG
jgi:hypothetical protein